MPPSHDLVVIDLDGTLLASDGRVSPGNVAAVARARAAGIEVVIATGRSLVESGTPLDAIGRDGHVITAGGSMLCDGTSGRTVHRSAMPHELVLDTTRALLGHGHKVLLLKDSETAGYDYLAVGPDELDPASAWWFETFPVRVRFVHDVAEDPHPDETVRVSAVAHETVLAPIAEDLRTALGDRGLIQHWGAVTSSSATGAETHLLEVFNPEVSKWTMVERLCAERGLPRERVAAIGDGLNDVEIIREAGLGIAMANADDRVHAVADRTTGHHDADGVATALDRIVGGAW